MTTRYFFGCILFFVMMQQSVAQNYTLSGYVRDSISGEDLVGAGIYVTELKKGTSTNHYGFYSITIPAGSYLVRISFVGYKEYTVPIKLDKNISRNFTLAENTVTTDEITVTAQGTDKNVSSVEMGTVELPIQQIKNIPALFGEVDILKTIQLLPGVQSAGEGNSGFYVRGGGPDQNLILLDEATVYNASHLFGFFSVFNADAIRNVSLTKGGMPAQYGGRLSSVLDISMKEGNMKKYEAEGGIGLISSRLTVQGPIIKDRSSFIVSARRTYIDVLMQPFISDSSEFKGSGYYFYDLNTKVNYRFSDKDRLFLSGYFGRDVFSVTRAEDGFKLSVPWGNATGSLRWNHLFSEHLFMNTSLVFTDYNFYFAAEQDDFEMKLYSGIRDYSSKIDFSWLPSHRHNIKFGAEGIKHIFIPGSVSARVGKTTISPDNLPREHALEGALYFNDELQISKLWSANAGLRLTAFEQIGPFKRYVKDELDNNRDTIYYKSGEKVKTYANLEPRFSIRFGIDATSSLKAAYTENYQYIHLANISSVSLPTDLWVPSSELVKPQFSRQMAVGYFKNFASNMYESSIELYYKTMDNLIEYKDGAAPEDNVGDNTDNNFTFGKGKSYGVELFFKKSLGNTTGWIGYTWAKTTRQFDDINYGNEFAAKYDRRHDVSIIVSHQLGENWIFSGVWVYATGNAATLPIALYFIEDDIISEYGERNSFRMPNYHRLDFSVTYNVPTKRRLKSSWNFSVYNAYNRHNPYFIYFETDGSLFNPPMKTTAKQVSLFPVLPSITWNFKF